MKSLKGKFIVISSIRVVECIDYDSDYDRVLLKSSSGEMFLRDADLLYKKAIFAGKAEAASFAMTLEDGAVTIVPKKVGFWRRLFRVGRKEKDSTCVHVSDAMLKERAKEGE
jgi:phage gp16-like protein